MSKRITVDPMTAYQEAQGEAEHWKGRALEHGSQRRMLQIAILRGGADLDELRSKLVQQMGGEEAVAALLSPTEQKADA